MSQYLSALRAAIKTLVRDRDEVIGETQYNEAINQALLFYSHARPYRKSVVVTGDGSTYQWTLPSDYYADFSSIVQVRFPADETDERELELLTVQEGYEVVMTDTGTYKLRLLSDTPTSAEKLRYFYTTLHTVTESSSTLPGLPAEQTIIFAAAAQCCEQIAAHYSQRIDPMLAGDSLNLTVLVNDYKSLAERYRLASGIKAVMENATRSMPVACVVRDFDPPPTYGRNDDFMVHTRHRR